MTTQEFIAKYEGWFSYTRREELKREMEADLESVFTALCQPPVIGSVFTCKNAELEKDSLVPVYCHNCNAYVQTDL